jgi:enoyl-CoA hydratase/carnithine racemase
MSETLNVERRANAAILTLNRPAKHNALSAELLAAIDDALAALDQDSAVRGIVITGTASVFSTGADLNEAIAVQSAPEALRYLERFRATNARIESLSKPVVAAINGFCLTGGLELSLACDLRIAGEGARFGVTSARIGSIAGAGAPQRLARLIGPSQTTDLLMSGRIIEAAEALRIGLVDAVVGAEQVLEQALLRIASYAERAPMSVWFSKLAVNTGLQMDLESALAFDRLLTTTLFSTRDRTEGMQAFLQKRSPVFTGR